MDGKRFNKLTGAQKAAIREKHAAKHAKAMANREDNEVTEMWAAIKQQRAEKRGHNRHASAKHLEDLGVPMTIHNCGAHIIIKFGGIWVDFWPGTGLFRAREPKVWENRGIFNLVKYLEDHAWRTRLSLATNPPPPSSFAYADCPRVPTHTLQTPTATERLAISQPEMQELPHKFKRPHTIVIDDIASIDLDVSAAERRALSNWAEKPLAALLKPTAVAPQPDKAPSHDNSDDDDPPF